jgi:hypothetical protein
MNFEHRLTGFLSTRLPRFLLAIGILFSAIMSFGFNTDPHHAYYSYLVAFIFFLGMSLSAMFLVMIQHLARAGWGILVRRIPELLMKNLPLMALLFLPILFGMEHIFHWLDPSMAGDHLIQLKSAFLNKPFFIIRAIVYFLVWIITSRYFFRLSVQQDYVGGEDNTRKMQQRAALGILLFALTYTFASFDWVMSLEPHWFSTIFGIYIFANSTLAVLCLTSLLYMLLRRNGFLREIVTVEHYHDIGRLIYGFIIFWTYITFSQFFLIWYANIPEETSWYLPRFQNGWEIVAIILVFGHFLIPLFGFMSRHVKRNLTSHAFMVGMILLMCLLDTYFVIMPTASPHFHLTLWDISAVIAIGSLFFSVFFTNIGKYSLIPAKDPYLGESIALDNA